MSRIFSRSLLIALVISFSWIMVVQADSFDAWATVDTINDLYIVGALDQDAALLYKFQAMFDPDQLPQDLKTAGTKAGRSFCLTPLILEAATSWEALRPETKRAISAYAEIPNLAAMAEFDPNQDPGLTAGTPTPFGFNPPNSKQTEHFNIQWGDSSVPNTDDINRLAEFLEYGWDIEIDEMGYPQPHMTDQYLQDVYIGNTGDGAPNISFEGAYVTIYSDSPYMAYMVIHPRILEYESASEEISAHEFFHTVQYGIVIDHRWNCYLMDQNRDSWMWEATAVWMEDVVFPDNNSYVHFLNVYARYPFESLNSQVDFYYQYSRVLFFKYIEEYQGGVDSVYEIWTECDPLGTINAIDSYLDTQDSNIRKAFTDFMIHNAVMDYSDGGYYDDMALLDTHSSYPVMVESIDSETRPRFLGANFILFKPDQSDASALSLFFEGDDNQNNHDVTWRVGIVAETIGGDYDKTEMDLDNNTGQIKIEGFGSQYRQVFMIPTVVKWEAPNGAFKGVDYKYAASYEASNDDDDDQEPSGDDDDDDDSSSSCGS